MTFLWPAAFLAMALIPILILLSVWMQRRRRRFAVRYSSLSLVRSALPAQSRLRRYLPMALLLLAMAVLVVSLARPVVTMRVPAGRATVILAIDVSTSMSQADIAPNRLAAAKQAAQRFVSKQKDTNQVGIVAYSGIAQLVQPPTSDPELLERAIHNLYMGSGTAIGEGIVTALKTIAAFSQGPAGGDAENSSDYQPDIIVLLTDGNNNRGIDPLEAADQARENGVRVYTIGYGSEVGATGGDAFGDNTFGRGGMFGRRSALNEAALQGIAAWTGGKYYAASSADELQKVFDSLPTMLVTRQERLEISVFFAALAALLVTAAVLLSQLWHPLP